MSRGEHSIQRPYPSSPSPGGPPQTLKELLFLECSTRQGLAVVGQSSRLTAAKVIRGIGTFHPLAQAPALGYPKAMYLDSLRRLCLQPRG